MNQYVIKVDGRLYGSDSDDLGILPFLSEDKAREDAKLMVDGGAGSVEIFELVKAK